MEFNIVSTLATLSELIGGGLGVWISTEVVKAAKFIPINTGQKGLLRSVAGLLSVAAVLLLGFVNQDLKPDDVQGVLQALIGIGVAWGSAHGTHHLVKKI